MSSRYRDGAASVSGPEPAWYRGAMIELLTTAEMAEADRLTIAAGAGGIDLMENAGRAVADCVAANHPAAARIIVVAGPGNNGGDGFVAARILAERGYRVRLLLLGDPDRLKGDAARTAKRLDRAGRTGDAGPPIDRRCDRRCAVRGGPRPAGRGPRARHDRGHECAPARVYAVDLPSGINGTSGR